MAEREDVLTEAEIDHLERRLEFQQIGKPHIRKLIAAAREGLAARKTRDWQPTHRHIKTDGLYRVLLEQVYREHDMTAQVVYEQEGTLIVFSRPSSEFHDGRFEEIPQPTEKREAHVAQPPQDEVVQAFDEFSRAFERFKAVHPAAAPQARGEAVDESRAALVRAFNEWRPGMGPIPAPHPDDRSGKVVQSPSHDAGTKERESESQKAEEIRDRTDKIDDLMIEGRRQQEALSEAQSHLRQCALELEEAANIFAGYSLLGLAEIYRKSAARALSNLGGEAG